MALQQIPLNFFHYPFYCAAGEMVPGKVTPEVKCKGFHTLQRRHNRPGHQEVLLDGAAADADTSNHSSLQTQGETAAEQDDPSSVGVLNSIEDLPGLCEPSHFFRGQAESGGSERLAHGDLRCGGQGPVHPAEEKKAAAFIRYRHGHGDTDA